MKATELRIGNHYNYHMKDEMDWRKEWMELSTIDVDDLKWLMDNPNDDDFHPIPISEGHLFNFGFELLSEIKGHSGMYKQFHLINIKNNSERLGIQHFEKASYWQVARGSSTIFFVHQLENLYYSLTGKELIYTP